MPDADIERVEQPGMIATLRALDDGQVDVGLAFNLVAFHAVKTEQVLGHRSDAITALTVAYETPAQIVVRSDSGAKTIADLKGKVTDLLEGRLDAYITWRGLPVPDFADAFATGQLRLLPLASESLEGLRLNIRSSSLGRFQPVSIQTRTHRCRP